MKAGFVYDRVGKCSIRSSQVCSLYHAAECDDVKFAAQVYSLPHTAENENIDVELDYTQRIVQVVECDRVNSQLECTQCLTQLDAIVLTCQFECTYSVPRTAVSDRVDIELECTQCLVHLALLNWMRPS